MRETGERVPRDDATDAALRARFAARRLVGADGITAFDATLTAARRRLRPRPAPVRPRLALALALLPLMFALVLLERSRAAVRADVALAREIGTLVQWRSPTASLLELDASSPGWPAPSIRASVIPMPLTASGGNR